MKLLYLIGPPGVGKTTGLRRALDGSVFREVIRRPFHHEAWFPHPGEMDAPAGYTLGVHDAPGGFAGTDALPMNVQPRVLGWLFDLSSPPTDRVVVGEGDRLANMKFLLPARNQGWKVTVCRLTGSPEALQARRDARGSNQDRTWIKGRETKVENLARAAHDAGIPVDVIDTTDLDVSGVAARLAEYDEVKRLNGTA